jgi:PAS domain S-box-containing protein
MPNGVAADFGDIPERQRAEEALRRSEERFRRYFELGLIGMAITSPTKGCLEVNDEMCRILGYTRDEQLQKTWAEMTHPDDLAADVAQFDRVMAGECDGYVMDKRFIRKDGRVIHATISVKCLRGEDGSVDSSLALAQDVTERKEAEERMRESQERLAIANERLDLAMRGSNIGIWEVDMPDGILENGRVSHINLWEQLGFDAPASTTATLDPQSMHPDDLERVRRAAHAYLSGEASEFMVENRSRHKDGSYRWVLNRGVAVRDATGKPIRFCGTLQDITQRKQAEEARALLAAIVESSGDAIISKTLDGIIGSWNGEAQRLFGYSPQEAIGQPITLIIPPERHDEERAILERLRCGERVEHFETVRVSKQGRRIDVSLTVSPLRDAEGQIVGASKVAREITERKRAEGALRQAHDQLEARVGERTAELARANDALSAEVRDRRLAEQTRTELLRRLSTAQEDERRRISRELHDQMGQQLTSLTLGLRALRDGSRGPEREFLARLQKTAEELGGKLHDLAVWLRPTALDDLGLRAALQSAVEEWSRRAGVEADFHSTGLEGRRLAEEVETTLYRVVLEAMHNTLKHARARHVSVILERRNDHVVAIIEDDGVGFDAEATPSSPAPDRLGLLGMRERLALVGGTLEVESAPGTGTTVFTRIPLLAPVQGGPL